MSMQRYSHEFQKISGSREMVENEDGEWIRFEDHEAALASERRANSELAMRGRMAEAALAAKDRELADANHMLILANNNANAFRRVAEHRQAVIERLQRAVEWLLDSTVTRNRAYAVGERKKVRHELRRSIRSLGRKRSQGKGRLVCERGNGDGLVAQIDVEEVEYDHSVSREGLYTRWMPSDAGSRLVRPRPPYWNNCGRVRVCEIGESTR